MDASIGRMVPVVTDELRAADPLMVGAEEYAELPVDAKGFRGPLPEIKNLRPAENFGYYARRKLFVHNMLHALAAYLGALSGHEYIWQCVEDRAIAGVLSQALSCIAPALEGEYGVPRAQTEQHGRELLARFANPRPGDTVARVGREHPPQALPGKAGWSGAALLCEKRGSLRRHRHGQSPRRLLFKAPPKASPSASSRPRRAFRRRFPCTPASRRTAPSPRPRAILFFNEVLKILGGLW